MSSYWPRYVPVAERRRRAAKKVASMKKAGREVSPVEIAGRKIATTFWGQAWCTNLEAYSDYENRLPRGRTYARNGSVIDLQIEAGRVRTIVSGSELYTVTIAIDSLAQTRWKAIKRRCGGQIDSLVELLRGSISKGVMEIVTRKGEGLFPSPKEISMDCSCPDWATMCKHVAASLYGVGARLDHRPELLFALRGVDPSEMVEAAVERPRPSGRARKGRVLASDELSSVFGVDIDTGGSPAEASAPSRKRKRTTSHDTRATKVTTRATASKAAPAAKSAAKKATRTKPAAKTSPIRKAKATTTRGAKATRTRAAKATRTRAAKATTPSRSENAPKKRAAKPAASNRRSAAKGATKKAKG